MSAKRSYKTGILLGHITLTEKQKRYLDIMKSPQTRIVFLTGSAGTGKTFLSLYGALHLWNRDQDKSIMYVRTVVESSDRGMGFLKGSIEDKLDPYTTICEERLEEIVNPMEMEMLKKKGAIEGMPIGFARGHSWKSKVVIADEFQNATKREIITLLTRIDKDTKIFVCGDSFQSDIKNSGFKEICDLFNDEESRENGIYVLEFDKNDIMRDGVVKFILERVEK